MGCKRSSARNDATTASAKARMIASTNAARNLSQNPANFADVSTPGNATADVAPLTEYPAIGSLHAPQNAAPAGAFAPQ